jgi:LysM repeat protein
MGMTFRNAYQLFISNVFIGLFLCAGAQETYMVLPGDTFARIARAQGMSLTALREANPDQAESLQPGDLIQVPELVAFPDLSKSTAWESMDSLLNHEIQSGDTWYALSKQYDVSVGDLREANPGRDASLQLGTFIRIPGTLASSPQSGWEEKRAKLLGRSHRKAAPLKRPAVIESDTLHLLAMLPYLLPVDTVEGGDFDAKTKRLREIALEFTHGIQWGAHLLKEAGFHVILKLVDTEADSLGALDWEMADLEWADVVLGPLRRSAMDTVASLLAPAGTPQWILTETPHHWEQYPHTLLIDASREAGMAELGKLAAQNHPNDTVIMLETKGKDAALEQAFLKGFRTERDGEEGLIVWPATSRFAEGLTALMDTSKLNVVAIPAGASARSMMAYVQTELQLADSFPVKLYTNPQSLSYEFLDWDFVDRVQWTLPTDNWMQRDDSVHQKKTSWYLKEFATEPSDYALRGCDAVIETAQWMHPRLIPVPSAMRTRFIWEVDSVSGKLRNAAWKLIEFSEGSWNEVHVKATKGTESR